MADQIKNLMIGIFVLSAIAIIVFILMFLHPTVGDEGQVIRVRFADIDKVSIGTRVTFAGRPIGEVISIKELPEIANDRVAHDGLVYSYLLELRIDSGINIYNTDEVSAKTSGLLGEKSIVITPLPALPGQVLRRVNDEVLYAYEGGSVEETLKELKGFAGKFEVVLDAIKENLDEVKKEKLWAKIGETAQNLVEITDALNNPEQLSRTLANVYQFSENLSKSWETIDTSLKNVATVTNTSKLVIGRIERGEGSLGALISRDDTYLKLNALLSKAEVTMNDINHYGVLFNLDKNWQRLRARRMNLLTKLSSPIEFRNYFNDEIDKITTSLERVSLVLSPEDSTYCTELLTNPAYTKVYSDLLRRVSSLEEELRMYNQQIIDKDLQKTELQQSCLFME